MVWAQVGMAGAQLGMSVLGAKSANKKAKSAARREIAITGLAYKEQQRQRTVAAAMQRGEAATTVGASNILMSGSAARYVRGLDYENMREIAYAKEARRLEVRAIEKAAEGAGDAMLYSGIANAAGAALSAYSPKAPMGGTASTTGLVGPKSLAPQV